MDASSACFGELIELLMLQRNQPSRINVKDASSRGSLFRALLSGSEAFRCVEGLGLYRAPLGRAETAGEATDFADNARVALKEAGLPHDAAFRLSGVLHELLGNVDEHAGGDATCLSGYSVQPGEAWLSVADTGDGVLAGYVSSELLIKPADARQALSWAVVDHLSRKSEPSRGTGFQTVCNAIRSLDASLRVRSDDASIELVQQGADGRALVREQGQLRGFVVSIHIRWARP